MSGFGPTGARFMFASDSKKARAGATRILLPPFRSSLVLSEMVRLTGTREDPTTVTPASVAKQHNEPFLCFSAWVLPHTREDPTTVTPASVAKQHNKPFLCLFSISAWVIPHMYTGGPHDRNTRQCRTTTQQTFPVSKMARAGAIPIFLLPSRSFSVVSNMVRASAFSFVFWSVFV